MKIIGTDNFARETVADILVAENIKSDELGQIMVKALNDKLCTGDHAPRFYKLVPDTYKLSRGMADLI